MADNTHIEWAEATWNPITGCSLASPGCTNCYAMQLAGTRLAHHESRAGLTREVNGKHVWTGEVRFNEQWLDQPLRWAKPRMIFVCAHGDLFHESVPDAWIDRIFAVMALCPQHTFQVLTKRSARMREFFQESTGWRARIAELLDGLKPSPLWNGNVYQGWQNLHGRPDGLPNVWLGVSVEDQQRADERIPDLLATPAAIRWISAEPLLGPVDLSYCDSPYERHDGFPGTYSPLNGSWWPAVGNYEEEYRNREEELEKLDWVVVGGESGKAARPMHPDWARSLRDQCAVASVPFFFKQWGEWWPNPPEATMTIQQFNRQLRYIDADTGREKTDPTRTSDRSMRKIGKKRAGRLLDGVEHNRMPRRA